ncbi:MAG: KOW domain-containing RNA-binding protein [Eubacteriales bacterium]|nr:KOW domain-containing RNA-binding protein [Eubacteriales bacterium]
MRANPSEIGRMVVSLQGHDRGRRFLVVGLIDERHVLIADGDTRKLAKPKKKQLKHLRAEPLTAPDAVITAVQNHAQTADSAIRKALKAAPEAESGETQRITDKEECALVQE